MDLASALPNKTPFGITDILGNSQLSDNNDTNQKDFPLVYVDGKSGYQEDCCSVLSDDTFDSNSSNTSSLPSDDLGKKSAEVEGTEKGRISFQLDS